MYDTETDFMIETHHKRLTVRRAEINILYRRTAGHRRKGKLFRLIPVLKHDRLGIS